jgi:hypothetical protein
VRCVCALRLCHQRPCARCGYGQSKRADDAVLTDQNGKVSTKAEVIANAKSGAVKFEVGQSADVKVSFYGDTAVVSSRWTEKSTSNGKQVNSTMQNTTVYVKRSALG